MNTGRSMLRPYNQTKGTACCAPTIFVYAGFTPLISA